jgi:rhodanese-related sulfurtransferase
MGTLNPRVFVVAMLPLLVFAVLAVVVWDNPLAPAQETRPAMTQPSTQPTTQPSPWQSVTAERFDALRKQKSILVDVRTGAEFQEGHIPGAVNININDRDFAEKIAKLDKTQTTLVYCASGYRSARACQRMQTLGFGHLFSLEGGIQAWKKAGKPVQ